MKARDDDIREQETAEDEQVESWNEEVLNLQIFCMHCPKAEPITISKIISLSVLELLTISPISWNFGPLLGYRIP
jgi:hypothetical protein